MAAVKNRRKAVWPNEQVLECVVDLPKKKPTKKFHVPKPKLILPHPRIRGDHLIMLRIMLVSMLVFCIVFGGEKRENAIILR